MGKYSAKELLRTIESAIKANGDMSDIKISIDTQGRLVLYYTQFAGEESIEITIYDSSTQKLPEKCVRTRF